MHTFDQTTIIPLWPDGAPGSEQWSNQEQESYYPSPSAIPQTPIPLPFDINIVRNIVQPTLTAYLPDPSIANGTSVIICPGGVYHFLAIDHEGTEVARKLASQGIAAFVLKYRVLQTEVRDEDFIRQLQERFSNLMHLMQFMQQAAPLAIADGLRSVKMLRLRAGEWGIAPEQIGVLGFSTGANVAIGTATRYSEGGRPNFVASIYPAPSGAAPAVPSDAPPLFLLTANDDPLGSGASLPLYSAWKDAGCPVELHVYAQGGHGFGMHKQGLPSDHWIERFNEWLRSLKLQA
jgi:acetyl esterase/lipase